MKKKQFCAAVAALLIVGVFTLPTVTAFADVTAAVAENAEITAVADDADLTTTTTTKRAAGSSSGGVYEYYFSYDIYECTLIDPRSGGMVPAETADESAYIRLTSLNATPESTVIIPSEINGRSVKEIGMSLFYECETITDVVIPASITTIQEYAFSYCPNLKSITILNPDCFIPNRAVTICNGTVIDSTTTTITTITTTTTTTTTDVTVTTRNGGSSNGGQSGEIWTKGDKGGTPYFNGVIYGSEGSTAEAYANEQGYRFAPHQSASETPTDTPSDGASGNGSGNNSTGSGNSSGTSASSSANAAAAKTGDQTPLAIFTAGTLCGITAVVCGKKRKQ